MLILDNIESIDYGLRLLAKHILRSKLGVVLVITIEREVLDAIIPDVIVDIHNITLHLARKMLVGGADRLIGSDSNVIELLLTKLSCLPLAIVQAVAYIDTISTTVEEYLLLLGGEAVVY